MNKIISIVALVALVCGCQSVNRGTEPIVPISCLPTLLDASKPSEHPEQKDWYRHDGRVMEILQFVTKDKVEDKELNLYLVVPHNFDKHWMTIAVITHNDYVGDELLRSGVYSYVGPYSYTNKNNDARTVRMFIEVPKDVVNKAIEDAKAEAEAEAQQDAAE